MFREKRLVIELTVLGMIALAWCCVRSSDPPPPTPPPADVADGCELACKNLERLGCPNRDSRGADDVGGTADDVPCARACREVQATVELNTACVAAARSCNEATSCN